jgi:hypothetical protein
MSKLAKNMPRFAQNMSEDMPKTIIETRQKTKGYGTGYSQAVTHPSTNPACSCLTSEIERDRVHSTEYGRIQ